MRGRDPGAVGDGERRSPQPCRKPLGVDAVGEPAVAVRELGVRLPVTGRPLVAVVELDEAEEAAVEGGGAELEIRDNIVFGHIAEQLVPGAPAGRHDDGS